MYLRDDRLNSLACYMEGMVYGLELAGVRNSAEERFLRAFGDWLGSRLDSKNGDCWFYLLQCISDKPGRVDDFYRELDEFLRANGFEHGLEDEGLDLKLWRKDAGTENEGQ
jgi:hypothetical protein